MHRRAADVELCVELIFSKFAASAPLHHGCGATTIAVIFLTTGRISSKTGKATSHEIPHEPIHIATKLFARPTLRKVLMAETMQVMMTDKKKGMTMPA
jgi:hypothetical protein